MGKEYFHLLEKVVMVNGLFLTKDEQSPYTFASGLFLFSLFVMYLFYSYWEHQGFTISLNSV